MSTEKGTNQYQRQFDRATEIGIDINKHLMSLSSGALGAYFFLFLNPKVVLVEVEKILLTVAIAIFGLAVFIALLVWQGQAEKCFLIGKAIDPRHKHEKSNILERKRSLDARLRSQKYAVRWLFIFGVLLSMGFIIFHVYGLPSN